MPKMQYHKPLSPQYIAGFFDGDGHIHPSGAICITQKDPQILYEIQAIYGGHIRTVRKIYYRLSLRVRERPKFISEVGIYSRAFPPC